MKVKRNNMLKIIGLIIILLFLTGCDNSYKNDFSYEDTFNNGGSAKGEIGELGNLEESETENVVSPDSPIIDNDNITETPEDNNKKENLKVISIFKMEAESTNIDESIDKIENITHKLGGYISSHSIRLNYENKNQKEANLAIRVPNESITKLSNFIKNELLVIAESSESIDVTDRYKDTQSIIENLETQESQLRKLYTKAIKLEEILILNDKLSEVTKEKEMLKKELIGMDDKVSYSSLNLTIKSVPVYTVVKADEDNLPIRIDKAMQNTKNKLKSWFESAIVLVIGLIPIIIPLVILSFIYLNWGRNLKNISNNNKLKHAKHEEDSIDELSKTENIDLIDKKTKSDETEQKLNK